MDYSDNRLSESFLYHIWDGCHLRLNELRTLEGHTVEIIYRGKWNMDAGPDFIGALIRFDGELSKGDVEIHLREEDWFHHKHHLDKAYNHVILHAVLWRTEDAMPIVCQNGDVLPTLVLSEYLDESLSRLQTKLANGSKHPKKDWPEVCLLSGKSDSIIKQRIEDWGLERLEIKATRYAEKRDRFQFNELLYHGICEALGYSKNHRAFLKLAVILGLDKIWPEIRDLDAGESLVLLQGIFFGASGFLDIPQDEFTSMSPTIKNIIQYLSDLWQNFQKKVQITPMSRAEWKFFRLRPSNFPTVRLAALCMLLSRRRHTGFMDPVLISFRDFRNDCKELFMNLERQFWVQSYGFWQEHVQLKEPPNRRLSESIHLIAKEKAREIVINAVLPIVLAYAEEAGDQELTSLVKQLYLSAPRMQSNRITRKMHKQLGLVNPSNGLANGCEQQGLIHMAKSLCPNWHCHECVHGHERRN